ncbi:MAG: radical SAM protein [Bacteroidales bacterium]|nr:radical SAM protein [Bacteroidales bacterium]
MISRCYLEITNICNLNCLFCPKTDREKAYLTIEEFNTLTDKLRGEINFLYFHLMGEPLLHPRLTDFIAIAREKGFVPIITTNGTLLSKAHNLTETGLHKIQISLHSQEGNAKENLEEYIHDVMDFSLLAAKNGIIVVLRLWNEGGYNSKNETIMNHIAEHVQRPWTSRYDGWKICENLYLEIDSVFEWPDTERDELSQNESFCYALRNQIGVLVDGTVVPCCLDHAGAIKLGNLHTQTLGEILSSPRAKAIYDGFTRHEAVEPLCKRCGYANVTKRFRK